MPLVSDVAVVVDAPKEIFAPTSRTTCDLMTMGTLHLAPETSPTRA